MHKERILSENNVRVIKISKDTLFEFIYEKMVEDQKTLLDVDPLDVINIYDIDWENGQFIFGAYKSEDNNGDIIKLTKEIDLQSLMHNILDTTSTLYGDNRYRDFTKEELIALSKKRC